MWWAFTWAEPSIIETTRSRMRGLESTMPVPLLPAPWRGISPCQPAWRWALRQSISVRRHVDLIRLRVSSETLQPALL